MVPDDVVYGLFMVTSVSIGPIFTNYFTGPAPKRLASAVIGLLLLWAACGFHIIHIFINVLGNCLLVLMVPPTKNEKYDGDFIYFNFKIILNLIS